MSPADNLSARWRERAERLRRYAPEVANAIEDCAAELAQTFREWEMEALTLEQAAAESGFSYSALQKRLASGYLPNAGSKHRPRVRRRDIPRKRGTDGSRLGTGEPDLAGERLRSQFGA